MPYTVRSLLLLLVLPFACTLLSEPFDPKRVETDSLTSRDAGGGGDDLATESADAEATPPCSSTELSGCPLPLTAVGSACTSDLDCESLACASGACAEASCSDGRRNGDEAGVDCGGRCSQPCCDGDECDSSSCAGVNCPRPSCDDRIANQGEADVDCAGPCARRCEAEQRCTVDADCGPELFCPEPGRVCTSISCTDGALNGDEILIDCGGGTCPGCPVGTRCTGGGDCADLVCSTEGSCAAASCDDGVKNQDETSSDCGGVCDPCDAAEACLDPSDCQSGVCESRACDPGIDRCCQAPTCNDNVRNGNEPSIDCGNVGCGLCVIGSACSANVQCVTGSCQAAVCRVHPCDDRVQNGNETDLDCGGNDPRCRRCPTFSDCSIDTDCASGACAGGTCVSCDDGIQNGSETGVDCGGSCGLCPGLGCANDAECATGACERGLCCGGSLVDCTRCARRLATGIDCTSNVASTTTNCNAWLQCLADNVNDCETPSDSECADDTDDVCNFQAFGGQTGPAVTLALAILNDAGCDP